MIVEGTKNMKARMGPGFSLGKLGQLGAVCQARVCEIISQWESHSNSSYTRFSLCQMCTSLYISYIYSARFHLRVWLQNSIYGLKFILFWLNYRQLEFLKFNSAKKPVVNQIAMKTWRSYRSARLAARQAWVSCFFFRALLRTLSLSPSFLGLDDYSTFCLLFPEEMGYVRLVHTLN